MENGQIFHNKYLLNNRKFLGLIRENASLVSNLKTQEMAFSGVDPGLPKTLTQAFDTRIIRKYIHIYSQIHVNLKIHYLTV